jgi:hypothetical protein
VFIKPRSIAILAALFAMILSVVATAAPNKKTIQITFPTIVGSSVTLPRPANTPLSGRVPVLTSRSVSCEETRPS